MSNQKKNIQEKQDKPIKDNKVSHREVSPDEEDIITDESMKKDPFKDEKLENGGLKVDDNLIEPGNVSLDFQEKEDVNHDKNNEYAREMEEEFQREIAVDKEEKAASEEELYQRMKRRIIRSFRWQEDIIIPFSAELKITPEELEEILMKRLDMSSLEAINPRFESARYSCTRERIHSDLKLCWLADVMNLLTDDEAEDIKHRITLRVVNQNEKYEDALEEGRRELVEYLKRKKE